MPGTSYLHGAAHLEAPANRHCPAQGRLPCRRATVPIAWRKIRMPGTTSKPRAALRAHRCTTGGTLPASKTRLPAVCGLATADIYTFFCFSTYGWMTASGAPPDGGHEIAVRPQRRQP